MAEGDIAYSNNGQVRYRQVGGIWVQDTPDAQTNPWYNKPEYQNPITYYRTQQGTMGAAPWTPPEGPAKTAIETARKNSSTLQANTQQQYNAMQEWQKEQTAIQEQRQKNMIMGFIPNPLQRFDKPAANLLSKSPFLIYPRKFAEEVNKAYPEESQPEIFKNDYADFLVNIPIGYAEDARQRPTKFVSEMALGFGMGKAFIWGESKLASLAAAGRVSPGLAQKAPTLVKGALAGSYLTMTGINVAAQPTPAKKGQVIGESLRELTGLGIGAGIAAGWRPRFGMTTQEATVIETERVVRKEPEVIDVRPVIDLSMKGVEPIGLVDPMTKVATPAERAMLINQYRLTPEEVTLARLNKLSVNDILQVRNRMELPETYFEPTKPVMKTQLIQEQPVKVRVRQMHGFVPDIFSSEITRVVPEARIIDMSGIDYRVDTRTIQSPRTNVDVMVDQILSPETITTTRTNQIVREETLITTITDQINTNITNQYYNNIFYTETPVKPIVPEMPKLTVPPIFPVPPLFPGGGGGGRSGNRWGFVFREDVSKGDPYGNLFTKFTGINLGLGKKRKTTKKKKTTTRRAKK